ncbi:hypothetical protein [Catellatospora coxensis]|nr:hypothetical protein [Catellatospora coxensis]
MAVAAATLLGLTGCATADGSAGSPAATTAAPVDASTSFAAATAALTTKPIAFTMSLPGQFSVTGSMDPANRRAEVEGLMTMSGKNSDIHLIAIGDDVWLKMSGMTKLSNSKWMHTTADRVTGSTFDIANPKNPGGIMNLINAVVQVEHSGATGFRGLLDMTKSPSADPNMTGAVAEKLSAVPFTATTDTDGNLAGIRIDMSAFAPGVTMSATYQYGRPVEVTAPPASDVMPMPTELLPGS